MTKNKGFTLIETMVVILVLGLLLTGVYAIFDSGVKLFAKDQTQIANQESIRTVLTSIEKKIRKFDSDKLISVDGNKCLVIPIPLSIQTDKYCLSNGAITFNDNPIIDRVLNFTPSVLPTVIDNTYKITVYSVNITIISIPDSMGQSNRSDATFNVRVKGR